MGDYFGIHPIASLILLIIPLTNWVCGIVTRVIDKCYVAAVLRFFFGFIVWVIEIILTIVKGCNVTLLRIINC